MCDYTSKIESVVLNAMDNNCYQSKSELQLVLDHLRYDKCVDCIAEAQRVQNIAHTEERSYVGLTYLHVAFLYGFMTLCMFILMLGGFPKVKPIQVFGMTLITVSVYALHNWMKTQRVMN